MKVLIAGDFAPSHRVAAQIEAGDYDCLAEVKPIIQSADYAIVNFESPVVAREAKPIEKTGPNLRCTEKALECITQAGFNCVTLANNHFRDYGQVGVEDTLDVCRKYHVDYVGGGATKEEAERILYKDINGTTLAIINCCEHEWSIATSNFGGSNPLDIISICHFIQEGKQKAKYVLVIVHGGTELYKLPSLRMKETYRFFIEQGADAVVNHHQHCYSGYEVYLGKPIFYGLGNFCFDKADTRENLSWEQGFMVELVFADDIVFKLYPFRQCDINNPIVRLIKDMSFFDADIQRLNAIIADDKQLKDGFESLALRGIDTARFLLAPYSSSMFYRLYSKRLLPSFATKKRLSLLFAHIQCESHKDVLLYGLRNKLLK